MAERLEFGKVYDVRVFSRKRKAIFLGRRCEGRKNRRNLIATRRYRGEGSLLYSFGDNYFLTDGEILLGAEETFCRRYLFISEKKTLQCVKNRMKEEYLLELFERKGI